MGSRDYLAHTNGSYQSSSRFAERSAVYSNSRDHGRFFGSDSYLRQRKHSDSEQRYPNSSGRFGKDVIQPVQYSRQLNQRGFDPRYVNPWGRRTREPQDGCYGHYYPSGRKFRHSGLSWSRDGGGGRGGGGGGGGRMGSVLELTPRLLESGSANFDIGEDGSIAGASQSTDDEQFTSEYVTQSLYGEASSHSSSPRRQADGSEATESNLDSPNPRQTSELTIAESSGLNLTATQALQSNQCDSSRLEPASTAGSNARSPGPTLNQTFIIVNNDILNRLTRAIPTQFFTAGSAITSAQTPGIMPSSISVPSPTTANSKSKYRSSWKMRPCYLLIVSGLFAIIGSLAPALWRSTSRDDISGGFSLAQYILGVGVFIIGSIVVIHSRTCTCWH